MQRRRFSFPDSFPRCCCAVLLCCVAVLFSTRSPPHAVLLATALSFSVVVRVLREGARVTWVCWCWLLCALVVPWCFLPAASRWCAGGYQGRYFACSEAWVSWCRCCGASCSKLLCRSITMSCHAGVGISLRRRFLRGCEGGYPPRRLVLKLARAPPQKQKPANGTSAGRQAMYARDHWRAPLSGFLAFPLDF
jgi:hypothetical protein